MHRLDTIKLPQPALRALHNNGIESLEQLTQYSENDLQKLHGFGPKALRILQDNMKEHGLQLKTLD